MSLRKIISTLPFSPQSLDLLKIRARQIEHRIHIRNITVLLLVIAVFVLVLPNNTRSSNDSSVNNYMPSNASRPKQCVPDSQNRVDCLTYSVMASNLTHKQSASKSILVSSGDAVQITFSAINTADSAMSDVNLSVNMNSIYSSLSMIDASGGVLQTKSNIIDWKLGDINSGQTESRTVLAKIKDIHLSQPLNLNFGNTLNLQPNLSTTQKRSQQINNLLPPAGDSIALPLTLIIMSVCFVLSVRDTITAKELREIIKEFSTKANHETN